MESQCFICRKTSRRFVDLTFHRPQSQDASVNDEGSQSPDASVNDGESQSPDVNDEGSQSPDVNDEGSPSPDVNDEGSPSPDVNDEGSPSPDVNDEGSPSPDVNDEGPQSPDVNDEGSQSPDVNDEGSQSPDVNDEDDELPEASKVSSTGTLIVVSNRLPFTLKKNKDGNWIRVSSAGGLVTAVAPVVINGNGFWVGWPGVHLEDPNEPIPESDPEDITPTAGLRSDKVIAVQMNPEVFDSFYNGCCNRAIWPLFHSMPDLATFELKHWNNYVLANEIFAEFTMKSLRKVPRDAEPALVWVHDSQLMIAARFIRQYAGQENIPCKLGFFLHIPFPPWSLFRIFYWSKEILQGMLACEVVGFHIEEYCRDFVNCCRQSLGCRVDEKNLLVEYEGRTVRVRPFPIGIPFDSFVEMARKAPELISKRILVDQKVILGVDRLDYTKGVENRMLAFEKFLEKHPEYEEKIFFIQISVPSRTDVKEYKDHKEKIDQLVGRINGKFGRPSWVPINYIYQNMPQNKLVSLYRDAAVCLATPLRDGMNLVCKEFAASQIKTPPGVLILSCFAGAAQTMNEALICNPHQIDHFSDVIYTALTMPKEEAIKRMNDLREREKLRDVNYWAKSFLSAMGCLRSHVGSVSIMPAVSYLNDFEDCI